MTAPPQGKQFRFVHIICVRWVYVRSAYNSHETGYMYVHVEHVYTNTNHFVTQQEKKIPH